MKGETNIDILLREMEPKLNLGEYVFCKLEKQFSPVYLIHDILFLFKEEEALTIILRKEIADQHGFSYSYIASWITLEIHSALEAVGLTAAFSQALAKDNISCNVVAAYYHDHIFVDRSMADRAMKVLMDLSAKGN